MKYLVLLLLFFPFSAAFAQDDTKSLKVYDFSEVDLETVNKQVLIYELNRIRKLNDSLNETLQTDSIYQLYLKLNTKPNKDYAAWYLSAGPSWSNLSELNKSLRANNLPTVGETAFDISYVLAFAWKNNRFFHDINMQFTFGGVEKDSLRINYNIIDVLTYKFGYSVVNAKRFEINPYVGLNLRVSSLLFENSSIKEIPIQTDNYGDLAQIAFNREDNRSTSFSKFEIPLDYGVEMSYHLKYSKRNGGFMLGFRYGQTLPFIQSAWRNNGNKFEDLPEINFRESYLTFLLKFYWRKEDKNQPYPYSNAYQLK